MDQRHLQPELWETLPFDLIDKIVDKVLVEVPFSRLLSFCCVCRRWKVFLLSIQYVMYFHKDTCMVFNSWIGLWESISLRFCHAEGLRLQDKLQVSSGRGLLYFTTDVNEEVIVCNPLTKRYKRLGGPAARLIYNAERGTRNSPAPAWSVAFSQVWYPSPFSTQDIYVKILASSDTGCFHLIVTKRYSNPEGAAFVNGRTAFMKDSRCSNWVAIADVPRGFCFIVKPTMRNTGSVILGFSACPGGFRVLAYDVELKRCRWISNVQTLHSAAPSTRKILVATLNGDNQLEFFEVLDAGPTLTLTRSPFPPSTKGLLTGKVLRIRPNLGAILELSEILDVVLLGQGDILYYISSFIQSPEGRVYVSVWTHNRADGSDRIANWAECEPSIWESGELPSARNFHIFNPSLLPPG